MFGMGEASDSCTGQKHAMLVWGTAANSREAILPKLKDWENLKLGLCPFLHVCCLIYFVTWLCKRRGVILSSEEAVYKNPCLPVSCKITLNRPWHTNQNNRFLDIMGKTSLKGACSGHRSLYLMKGLEMFKWMLCGCVWILLTYRHPLGSSLDLFAHFQFWSRSDLLS